MKDQKRPHCSVYSPSPCRPIDTHFGALECIATTTGRSKWPNVEISCLVGQLQGHVAREFVFFWGGDPCPMVPQDVPYDILCFEEVLTIHI